MTVPSAEPVPAVTLLRMMSGAWIAQTILLAAQLGLADLIAELPRRSSELAAATSMHPPSLYRVLRALASVGIFREDAEGCFHLTPLAELLRSDVAGSLRPLAILFAQEWHTRAWADLQHCVKTGQSAFEHLHGMTNFEYLAQHPEAEAIFDHGMTSRGAEQEAAVLAAFDFDGIRTLVDVGGGRGSFLAAILRTRPDMRGVLFDRPEVTSGAIQFLEDAGMRERCEVASGDFFRSVPGGADAYVLKSIIHDWDDERALAILKTCRRAMSNGARLLLIDWIVPPGNQPSFAKLLDLQMLVWTPGGRERTELEFRDMLGAAGFDLTRITSTGGSVSVLESVLRVDDSRS